MIKLRCLRVQFDGELSPRDIPAFRGAIAARVGLEHTLFHNHQPDGSLRYRYPLIQYKLLDRRPTLMCLDKGVEAVQYFLQQPDWRLVLNDREVCWPLHRLDVKEHALRVTDHPLTYHLENWLALNQENVVLYERTAGLGARLQLLEKLLTAHILSFASGVGWQVDAPLQVELLDLHPPRLVQGRGHKALAFTGTFRVNAFLPDGIGFGRHVSIGYGIARHPRAPRRHTHRADFAESINV